ncbi:MAG: GTP diphosphokinase [Endozoicomonadaceae bacterium]|nr:GTP diphosphokinase [Endozoicomonadaceae bacterium]
MVKVREDYAAIEEIDMKCWQRSVCQSVGESELPVLKSACHFIREYEYLYSISYTDSTPLQTGMEMVDILASLHLDEPSLVAAFFYRFVREKHIKINTIKENFGEEVAKLIDSVLGMAAINVVQIEHDEQVLGGNNEEQLKKIRKMLVSIIDDVRVALIKIAERTCIIKLIRNETKQRRLDLAREVFSIYAPLAHRLGIGYIKWELEDLAFSHLNSNAYKRIAKLLDERRIDREKYLKKSISTLNTELEKAGVSAQIHGRVKHIYSIWKKMQRKSLEFHELYDIRAIRVLVNRVQDCYMVLGIVHNLWRYIPHEFDDYIATPKNNGYRSLHTAVLGPEGKTLEIQIRTHDMHEEAELGVCSHWAYKGTDNENKSDSYDKKLNWLRQVLQYHDEIDRNVADFVDQWSKDVKQDRVYVFTRDGHVVDLPSGATPVDFAYKVHTEVGHRCRGAKISGRIVPLTYTLKTGDQISILTADSTGPSRDWLNSELGYVCTSRARAKIINWFRKQDKNINVVAGKNILKEECRRLALTNVDYKLLAHAMNFNEENDLFAACGAGDVRIKHVVNLAQKQIASTIKDDSLFRSKQGAANRQHYGNFIIEGVGNLLTQIAGCCNPVPDDAILGYITQGRGVTIHRADCANVFQLQEQEPEKIVAVTWGQYQNTSYPVKIRIEAFDRPGLISDILLLLGNEKINIASLRTYVSTHNNMASLFMNVEVNNLNALGRLLSKINQIPNVVSVVRNGRKLMYHEHKKNGQEVGFDKRKANILEN